jgi:hypothetical protein
MVPDNQPASQQIEGVFAFLEQIATTVTDVCLVMNKSSSLF